MRRKSEINTILFEDDNAICPFCRKDGAHGTVYLKKSPFEDELDLEIIYLLIFCQREECQKQLGMGQKMRAGKLLQNDSKE